MFGSFFMVHGRKKRHKDIGFKHSFLLTQSDLYLDAFGKSSIPFGRPCFSMCIRFECVCKKGFLIYLLTVLG